MIAKTLVMCHIRGHIKREIFTRLSCNLVAWKLEMIIDENARDHERGLYDDNMQYFTDHKN